MSNLMPLCESMNQEDEMLDRYCGGPISLLVCKCCESSDFYNFKSSNFINYNELRASDTVKCLINILPLFKRFRACQRGCRNIGCFITVLKVELLAYL